MEKNKIPTAEEMVVKWENAALKLVADNKYGDPTQPNLLAETFKEFAKLHVKAALEAAAWKHEQIRISPVIFKELRGLHSLSENVDIEKKIILNAYPETNIK